MKQTNHKRKQLNHSSNPTDKRGNVPAAAGEGGRRGYSRAYYERRKRIKKRRICRVVVLVCLLLLVIGILYLAVLGFLSLLHGDDGTSADKRQQDEVSFDGDIGKMSVPTPKLDVQLLTVNKYSRPGTRLEKVNGVVIHYVGNAGTTAAQNRSYFESLKDTHKTSASSHFVIGMEGEIIQCIPTSEIAYASNNRNEDTVSIECCHPKKDGKFTDETYDSLVELTAFLCCKYDLEMEDIIRHYDVTGKECPKYYVKHEEEWIRFKKDVAAYIKKHGTKS